MKRYLIIALCTIGLLTSCQKQERLTTIDFGSAGFEEPFRGLLASHPAWLVATLDWPVLRSLKPDTAVLSKTIEIGFNEDAIRSNSSVRMFVVDENGYTSSKYQVFCNQEPIGLDGYEIKASSEPQRLMLSVKIDPSIGDSTATGYISVIGNEIDEVNTIPLTEEGSQNIAQWSFYHELDWPLLIWIIWVLMLIVLVVGVLYLLKCLIIGLRSLIVVIRESVPQLFNVIGPAIASPFIAIYTAISKFWSSLTTTSALITTGHSGINYDTMKTPRKDTIKRNDRKKDIKDKNNNVSNDYIDEALRLERMLFDQSFDVASKNDILEKLRLQLEDTKESNPKLNEECYQALRHNTQEALDKFNEFYGSTPKDSNGGIWSGERAKSTYILSNQNTYYSDCKKCGMLECSYNDSFEPDFSKVTHPNSVVDITDLYGKYTSEELKKRGGGKTSFQEVAQMRMAQNLDPELRTWWSNHHKNETYNQYDAFWEWRDANDLLPHEDANCKTMRLVKRPAHEAFTHAGGISHARAIKKYFG